MNIENDPEVRAAMARFGFDALTAWRHVQQRRELVRMAQARTASAANAARVRLSGVA